LKRKEKKRPALAAADVATYQRCAVRSAAQDGQIAYLQEDKTKLRKRKKECDYAPNIICET